MHGSIATAVAIGSEQAERGEFGEQTVPKGFREIFAPFRGHPLPLQGLTKFVAAGSIKKGQRSAQVHISLTSELEQIVREKVASGFYNNASEVVREALRQMVKNDELERLKLERLREAVAIGAEQAERGEFVDQTVSEIAAEAKRERYG